MKKIVTPQFWVQTRPQPTEKPRRTYRYVEALKEARTKYQPKTEGLLKKIILCLSLLLIFGISLTFAKQPAKKIKNNPVTTQCDKSGQDKPHPETWASCCKGHGGKVKKEAKAKEGKEGWDCDAESEAKAKELAGDEEDTELLPPPEESDESVGR